ncbi:AP2 domain-containing protein [Flintibacter muris]|uniref:AP2 domain-containing protein n=1 Tax=Flintibacter muris TaxID=2941327 RepID=UPI0020414E51|nr:AP2 domain-containing protein [Flintibacter muris]
MGHSTKKLDLTGQKYGKLTVLTPAERINGRTAWRCRCDCGQEKVVRTSHLRDGHTTSCGCVRGEEQPRSRRERTGARGPGLQGLTYIDGTCIEMLAAKTVRSNNTSGVPGVDWRASKGVWRASICFKGRRMYLGSYGRFEDAVRARKRAEEELHDSFVREFAQAASEGAAEG